jgi:signal peptidase I
MRLNHPGVSVNSIDFRGMGGASRSNTKRSDRWRTDRRLLAEFQLCDVIVFRYPFDPSQYYVKRVVGLPGDRIRFVDRTLFVNDERVEERPIEDFFDHTRNQQYRQFDEHLGDSSYRVIYSMGESQKVHAATKHTDLDACVYSSGGVTCTVQPRCYFVLGDNRENSEDSRYWGFVPDRNIAGKVFLIWWNERLPERIGTAVR